ncbi:AAA domain-containing protein [Zobellella sp. An-6]|uniref:AAA domain-containing protein n=1 Tax=Zobellella sp. An-6 TaxID=3400218 RepID=UPI00404100DA
MSFLHKITGYFRQSLIDAERLSPDDRNLLPALGIEKVEDPSSDYLALDHQVWLTGRISPALARQILDAKQPAGQPPLEAAEVVLFPRVDLQSSRYGEINNLKRRVLLPVGVFVRVLADGTLFPSNKRPWIPREWLAPNQSATDPIGDYVNLDTFLTRNPYEGIVEWGQLVAYCCHMLATVVGHPLSSNDGGGAPGVLPLHALPIHPDFEISGQSLLQLEPNVVGAKANILKVLNNLRDSGQYPPLYQRFCAEQSPELSPHQDLQHQPIGAKGHLGQMTGEFPLSPKQRNALHHFLAQRYGEILAVNGPPGTGKTTLLRSVVANLWSEAALAQGEPPLIVAASNNNQAVTNILESFAKIDEEGLEEPLKGRWLPEVDSYGLYCCSSAKVNVHNPYMYLGPKGEGCMESWHTREYLDRAKVHFLICASQWLNDQAVAVSKVQEQLHRALQQTKQAIEHGVTLLGHFQEKERELNNRYGGIASLHEQLAEAIRLHEHAGTDYRRAKAQLDEMYGLWEQRSVWARWLMWLSPVKQHEQRKTARLLNSWELFLDDHSDNTVERALNQRIQQAHRARQHSEGRLSELQQVVALYQQAEQELKNWIAAYQPTRLFSHSPEDQVHEVNDRSLRFTLFKLATHYWEARWLQEYEGFLSRGEEDKKSPRKLRRKLRRLAKLTPCFVSTFYMIPSTFMAYEMRDNCWRDIPLFDEIDLLIVDEAGQAVPDVAAASFALAKRALIVGDTDQIEPVWSIPAYVDRANLELYGLLNEQYDYDDFWQQSGLLASGGSVMGVAQRQCLYHQFAPLQRGLYLTEHRRCYDQIVDYCNTMVYEGILEPLRGSPRQPVPWGTFAMVATASPSRSYGGSRGNPGEAEHIAKWLQAERDQILAYARQHNPKWAEKDDQEVLKLAVGIITPFSKQARLIRQALDQVGVHGLTVGTVHSLQGDERTLVLFSSVYGENDISAGKFYDMNHNMLNVAVSRAKDSFIVFGHPHVFGATAPGSPSGLLRKQIDALHRQDDLAISAAEEVY